MLFAMTSKVRKKRKNLKINRESEDRFKKKISKSGRSSALSEDLAGLRVTQLYANTLSVGHSLYIVEHCYSYVGERVPQLLW